MPSSTWVHTSTVCDLLWKYRASQTVLDLGIGFGRWGFLCREMLDAFQGRNFKFHDNEKYVWRAKIDGVEIYEPYLQDHHYDLYDELHVEDCVEFLEMCDKYDLIIAGDVLEHYKKPRAHYFLKMAHEKCKRAAIFGVPLGTGYPQGAALGNKNEIHQSTWEKEEFDKLPFVTRVTVVRERVKNRPYAVVLIEK